MPCLPSAPLPVPSPGVPPSPRVPPSPSMPPPAPPTAGALCMSCPWLLAPFFVRAPPHPQCLAHPVRKRSGATGRGGDSPGAVAAVQGVVGCSYLRVNGFSALLAPSPLGTPSGARGGVPGEGDTRSRCPQGLWGHQGGKFATPPAPSSPVSWGAVSSPAPMVPGAGGAHLGVVFRLFFFASPWSYNLRLGINVGVCVMSPACPLSAAFPPPTRAMASWGHVPLPWGSLKCSSPFDAPPTTSSPWSWGRFDRHRRWLY